MHEPIAINDTCYWVGVNDFETHLFESIWPLPQGISYNSFVIIDEKVVLIDTVKGAHFSPYLDQIHSLLNGRKIDYLVINHMEPDHSGSLRMLLSLYPDIKVIGNKKTLEYIESFYHLKPACIVVGDGESVNIGQNTLQFFLIPMVHWPETMVTFLPSNGALFSGDAFGGFGALNGGVFDDEVDLAMCEYETLRYFSNIIGKFSGMVQKAIKKIAGLNIKLIAPTHGPIFRTNPSYVVKQYDRWSRYEADEGVVIVYASMYGNTQVMAETVARALTTNGIRTVLVHNVSTSHLSFIVTDIWRYRGVILGSCTYNTKLFPLMDLVVHSLDTTMMKHRVAGIFGSYTWSGGGVKGLRDVAQAGMWVPEEPIVEVKSSPTAQDRELCTMLGKAVAVKIKAGG